MFVGEKRLFVKVYGSVQGVSFRYYAKKKAEGIGIKGYVMNCPDGTVEIEAEGNEELLRGFLEWCRQGPSSARVDDVKFQWKVPINEFAGFSIKY